MKASGSLGDIAIDDIQLQAGSCSGMTFQINFIASLFNDDDDDDDANNNNNDSSSS